MRYSPSRSELFTLVDSVHIFRQCQARAANYTGIYVSAQCLLLQTTSYIFMYFTFVKHSRWQTTVTSTYTVVCTACCINGGGHVVSDIIIGSDCQLLQKICVYNYSIIRICFLLCVWYRIYWNDSFILHDN